MAELRLVTARDPRLLLERAAECFLAPARGMLDDPFPTPPVLLALRQGGLRDDLIRLAAERGVKGWFDPPLCIFHELPKWLGDTGRRACGEVERLVLLERLFREEACEVFSHLRCLENYLDAVARLFGELCAEDVTPDAFAAACAARPARDEFEVRRDAELARVYRAYRARLEERGLRDGRDGLADMARSVAADPAALAGRLGDRREIRFLGLADLRGGWRALLRALVESPVLERIAIYTSAALDLGEIPHTHVALPEGDSLAGRLFTDAPRGRERVEVIVAPDPGREAEEVACRVRALLDSGVAPHRIAVVARQARPHVDRVVEALAAVGVPASARQRVGMTEIPAVRALLALLDAAAEGWTRTALVEIAEHPYFDCALRPRILDHIGRRERLLGLAAWDERLAALLERAEAAERRALEEPEAGEAAGEESWRDRPPAAARVREALAGFREFRARAERLDGARPVRQWLALLAELLREDPWRFRESIFAVPAGRVRLARRDLAGWRALLALRAEWHEALNEWGGGETPLDAAGFARRLRELLEGEVPLWTEAHRGVLVQEALAAVYRSFDHLFLVGLEAGAFPVRAAASPILDASERDELAAKGLPLDATRDWEQREAELFRALVAGARESLTLSYAALDASGREVIASSFVEAVEDATPAPPADDTDEGRTVIRASRVLTPGFPVYFDLASADHVRRVARVERVRQAGLDSPYNGRIEDPELLGWLAREYGDERIWRIADLESFAKCPWSFLAARLLRLESAGEPSDDLDALTRSRILRAVIERLFQAAAQRNGGGPVLLRREEHLDWALAQLEHELDAVLAGHREALGNPALHAARREELLRMLRKYLEFEMEENRKLFSKSANNYLVVRTGVVAHGIPFNDVRLEVDGVAFRYRGTLDRVEEGIDDRVPSEHFAAAVAYGTSTSSLPGGDARAAWEDGVVLKVPLHAHALAHLRPDRTVARAEYRALRSCKVVHRLQLHSVEKKNAVLVEDAGERERYEAALAAVVRHLRELRAGSLPARPAPSCKCSPYCVAWDLCRVKGGPETKKGW